jgi:calcium channel MID1
VPGNDNKFNGTTLAQTYDNYAKEMYSNFEKSMMQIPCDADSSSAYSLVRNCDDCAAAYKQWLCTVAFPRCEDVTSTNPWAVPRNMGARYPNGSTLADGEMSSMMQSPWFNTSRNSWIDTVIEPGPYKEVLPCADLCYQVVQSCPAALGFTCPRKGRAGFQYSYGEHASNSSSVSCNYPGEALTPVGAAGAVMPSMVVLLSLAALTGFALL